MSQRWILTALGKDRPGIVAGVPDVLFWLGCNLEDSAMTRLEGEFAIMVIFSAPDRLSAAALERAFRRPLERLGLVGHLKRLTRAETVAARYGAPYRMTVYGADRPGLVFRISQLLARLKVNITDLSTHRSSGSTPRARAKQTKPLYLMILELELPPRLSAASLERKLRALAKRVGVQVALQSTEPDIL